MGKGRYVVYSMSVVLLLTALAGCSTGNPLIGRECGLEEQEAPEDAEADMEDRKSVQAAKAAPEKRESIQDTEADSEEQNPAQDIAPAYDFSTVEYDLSAIPAMENEMYAAWDGGIYFRQYSDEDMEDGALWADFGPIADTEKELMRMEPDGRAAQAGVDCGCGSMYIVGGRLYSQRYLGEENYEERYRVYSSELDGSSVTEYASARVLAAKGSRIICQTADHGLAFIDAQTGQEQMLVDDRAYYLDAAEKEIFFYKNPHGDGEDAYDLTLCSADYEGGVKELKTITRAEYTEYMGNDAAYMFETALEIPCFRILGDDLYFSAGSRNGNAHMYSGGPIYSMKKDGSGCRVVTTSFDEYFYLYDDGKEEFAAPFPYAPYDKPYLHGATSSVLFYPDTSGTCYVLLSAAESEELSIALYADGSMNQTVRDVEYIGGRLFFTVVDLTYNGEQSIGWRDYYDRGQSRCYCKEMGSGETRLLYAY